jgi:RNA polymerase sigma factor (sigma-70 family)
LYQAHFDAVLRVCARVMRNADDAADAAQEVFLIALDSLRPEAPAAQARSWLLTVARNHCLDLLRRRKRLGNALAALAPESTGGRDIEAGIADRELVGSVFKQLSSRERQALWDSAVESRPLADIADRLRLTYMAAAQVVHRARQHAAYVATRVAIALGAIGLGRQRARQESVWAISRLAAVAAVVPFAAVVIQSSSSSGAPAAIRPGTSTIRGEQVQGLTVSVPSPTPAPGGAPTGLNPSLPPAGTPPLPSLPVSPLPSLPVSPIPSLLPSVPVIPLPTAPPLPIPTPSLPPPPIP